MIYLTMNFKKINAKSPHGGHFDLFINDTKNIVYKKIRPNPCRQQQLYKYIQNNIVTYNLVLTNLSKLNIINKYILNPKKVRVNLDGSYYSTFIPNGIRLYDINLQSIINKNTLNNILNRVKELNRI